MKRAFLILGAQRSGTSATSHVLSQLGVDFGNQANFIQFDHNPIFFELDWVNRYNNDLINALGHRYTDFFLPNVANFATDKTAAIEAKLQQCLIAEWGDAPVIGIKDPRLSLTFPIWEGLLADQYCLHVVLVFRHPIGFLKSNQKLFHGWEGWDAARHLKFWLQLNLSAAYLTRHLSIHYVDYDQLIQHPLSSITRLAKDLQLDPARIIDAVSVLDAQHYHTKSLTQTEYPLVNRCYEQLRSQTLSQFAAHIWSAFEFDAVAATES